MTGGVDGQVITFYSYKGGVGRSMAVANVGATFAFAGKSVLLLDFDFEAPGLHRYFTRELASRESELGVVEFISSAFAQLVRAEPESQASDANSESGLDVSDARVRARKVFASLLDSEDYVRSFEVRCEDGRAGYVGVMPSGVFDSGYPDRVRMLDWVGIHERLPLFFSAMAAELSARFDYILIDSRTGITDVGSVCTVLLPEKLVLVFTANEQSLNGAVEVGRQAVMQRTDSDDLRPLPLFPLLSRVENSEDDLQRKWTDDACQRFETVFRDVYGMEHVDLREYFQKVQAPHRGFYAYGEVIAAERDGWRANSLGLAYATFGEFLGHDSLYDAQIAMRARNLGATTADLAEQVARVEAEKRELERRVENLSRPDSSLRIWVRLLLMGLVGSVLVGLAIAYLFYMRTRAPSKSTTDPELGSETARVQALHMALRNASDHDFLSAMVYYNAACRGAPDDPLTRASCLVADTLVSLKTELSNTSSPGKAASPDILKARSALGLALTESAGNTVKARALQADVHAVRAFVAEKLDTLATAATAQAQAQAELSRAIELVPGSAPYLARRARIEQGRAQYKQAADDYQAATQALLRNPSQADFDRPVIQMLLEQLFAEPVVSLTALYRGSATSLEALGRNDAAIDDYGRAIATAATQAQEIAAREARAGTLLRAATGAKPISAKWYKRRAANDLFLAGSAAGDIVSSGTDLGADARVLLESLGFNHVITVGYEAVGDRARVLELSWALDDLPKAFVPELRHLADGGAAVLHADQADAGLAGQVQEVVEAQMLIRPLIVVEPPASNVAGTPTLTLYLPRILTSPPPAKNEFEKQALAFERALAKGRLEQAVWLINGFPPATIKNLLAKQTKEVRDALHDAAVQTEGVGPQSSIAQMTNDP